MFSNRHSNSTRYSQLDDNNNETDIMDAHEILRSIVQLRSLIRETKSLRILTRIFPRLLRRLFPLVTTLKALESEWERYAVTISQLFFKTQNLESQLKKSSKCSLCNRVYR